MYFENVKSKADIFAHDVYRVTRKFPKNEIFGATSQIRRAALSVVLNLVEGFARGGNFYRQFCRISYGSLQETRYLVEFCFVENYLSEEEKNTLLKKADELGAMIWGIIKDVPFKTK